MLATNGKRMWRQEGVLEVARIRVQSEVCESTENLTKPLLFV